jgi:phytoene dehydrogenase-like protein
VTAFIYLYISVGICLKYSRLTEQGIRSDLGIHHIVVNDWERGVDADQNVVLISVPSVLTPNLAPIGKHVLHAYLPGTEPFELWEGLDRRSAEYKNLKDQRSEVCMYMKLNE